MSRKIKRIILHISASEFGGAILIDDWHTNGNGWDAIGYHFVICNGYDKKGKYTAFKDGAIETGRDINIQGAHAKGMNSDSIGICMIGKDGEFTWNQIDSLIVVLHELINEYDIDINDIIGHYETPLANGKTCPDIKMDKIRSMLKGKILKVRI
jgi:N-acetylmuramoyl-L-alanine amidase